MFCGTKESFQHLSRNPPRKPTPRSCPALTSELKKSFVTPMGEILFRSRRRWLRVMRRDFVSRASRCMTGLEPRQIIKAVQYFSDCAYFCERQFPFLRAYACSIFCVPLQEKRARFSMSRLLKSDSYPNGHLRHARGPDTKIPLGKIDF